MAGVCSELEGARPGRYEPFHSILSTSSTNQVLLEDVAPKPGCMGFCIAREQTEGRGRQGRRWLSQSESGLTFSLSRRAAYGEVPDTRLPLVAAVAVARVLRHWDAVAVGIKWPNDLVDRNSGAKLGGILIEGRAATVGQDGVWVLGVGLNVEGADALVLDRPVTDLIAMTRAPVRIEPLLAALVLELGDVWERFVREGFAPFLQEYAQADWLRGQEVVVATTGERGIASGIDADTGRLRVLLGSGQAIWVSGEVVSPQSGS
jgi:BirA family biotin operon repressor/biotin-[acetyl-CoA-carboxylase] ligase